MVAVQRNVLLSLLTLLVGYALADGQGKTPPPSWSEGGKLTASGLQGIWWIKFPFRLETMENAIVVNQDGQSLGSEYVSFDSQGIIYQASLSGPERRNAIGVWLLQGDQLQMATSDESLELQYYQVQPDKIVVAGTCSKGERSFAVAGVLLRLREGHPIQMEE